MASTRPTKERCSECGTMVGIFQCRGCERNFCLPHTRKHRDALDNNMKQILDDFDRIKSKAEEKTSENFQKKYRTLIEEWAQRSIEEIRRYADETQNHLDDTFQKRSINIQKILARLQRVFDEAQHDGGFYEQDLNEWAEEVDRLKDQFDGEQEVHLRSDTQATPLVARLALNGTAHRLEQKFIKEYAHGQLPLYPRNQEQKEFSSGQHERLFKIESGTANCSVLFGIISKHTADHADPYRNPTLYGWGQKGVYRGGVLNCNDPANISSAFRPGDIIELIIDCEEKKITLKKEEGHYMTKLTLLIDTEKCRFPWLLHVYADIDDNY